MQPHTSGSLHESLSPAIRPRQVSQDISVRNEFDLLAQSNWRRLHRARRLCAKGYSNQSPKPEAQGRESLILGIVALSEHYFVFLFLPPVFPRIWVSLSILQNVQKFLPTCTRNPERRLDVRADLSRLATPITMIFFIYHSDLDTSGRSRCVCRSVERIMRGEHTVTKYEHVKTISRSRLSSHFASFKAH